MERRGVLRRLTALGLEHTKCSTTCPLSLDTVYSLYPRMSVRVSSFQGISLLITCWMIACSSVLSSLYRRSLIRIWYPKHILQIAHLWSQDICVFFSFFSVFWATSCIWFSTSLSLKWLSSPLILHWIYHSNHGFYSSNLQVFFFMCM